MTRFTEIELEIAQATAKAYDVVQALWCPPNRQVDGRLILGR